MIYAQYAILEYLHFILFFKVNQDGYTKGFKCGGLGSFHNFMMTTKVKIKKKKLASTVSKVHYYLSSLQQTWKNRPTSLCCFKFAYIRTSKHVEVIYGKFQGQLTDDWSPRIPYVVMKHVIHSNKHFKVVWNYSENQPEKFSTGLANSLAINCSNHWSYAGALRLGSFTQCSRGGVLWIKVAGNQRNKLCRCSCSSNSSPHWLVRGIKKIIFLCIYMWYLGTSLDFYVS